MNAHQRRVKLRKMQREAEKAGRLPPGVKLSKANLYNKKRLNALKAFLRDGDPPGGVGAIPKENG